MGHVSHTGGKFKINQAGCSDAHWAAHLFFQCPLVASLKPHEKCKHGDAVEPCVCVCALPGKYHRWRAGIASSKQTLFFFIEWKKYAQFTLIDVHDYVTRKALKWICCMFKFRHLHDKEPGQGVSLATVWWGEKRITDQMSPNRNCKFRGRNYCSACKHIIK